MTIVINLTTNYS